MRIDIHRAVIAVLAIGLYSASIGFDYAYDDALQITLNPQVTESTITTLYRIFLEATPPGNLYRPVATVSHALIYLGVGNSPLFPHLVNVLLYVCTCLLVHAVLTPLIENRWITLLASLIFTAHPLHSEVVANIIGRAEMGAAFFCLACCLFAKSAVTSSRSLQISISLSAVAMTMWLASLCKESSLTMCAIVPVYALFLADKTLPTVLRFLRTVPLCMTLLGAASLSLLMRKYALGPNFTLHPDGQIWPENPLFHLPFTERIVPSLVVLGDYLRLLLLPLHQSADYSEMPTDFFARIFSFEGALSGAVLAAFLGFASLRGTSLMRFFSYWIVVSFILTINLIVPIGTIMGERLAFLPSVGAAAFIALWFRGHERTTSARILAVGYVATLSTLTILRTPVWRDNATLFAHTIVDAPRSPKAFYNLGVSEVLKDPTSTEAEALFRRSREIHPGYVLPTRALADIMLARKDWGRLEYWYRQLLALTPNDEAVRTNLQKLQAFKESRR